MVRSKREKHHVGRPIGAIANGSFHESLDHQRTNAPFFDVVLPQMPGNRSGDDQLPIRSLLQRLENGRGILLAMSTAEQESDGLICVDAQDPACILLSKVARNGPNACEREVFDRYRWQRLPDACSPGIVMYGQDQGGLRQAHETSNTLCCPHHQVQGCMWTELVNEKWSCVPRGAPSSQWIPCSSRRRPRPAAWDKPGQFGLPDAREPRPLAHETAKTGVDSPDDPASPRSGTDAKLPDRIAIASSPDGCPRPTPNPTT